MPILDQFGEPWLDPLKLPDIQFNLTAHTIQAKPRKLKSTISMGAAQDFRADFGGSYYPEPSVIDRLGAITYASHRDVAQHIAGLPDDLIPADVKDMALGAILDLIPKAHWPSANGSSALDWDKSVIGIICEVVKARAG